MNKKILFSAVAILLSGCPWDSEPPCTNPNGCSPPPPPKPCSYEYELTNKYSKSDYDAIKVGLNLDIPSIGTGVGVNTGLINDHVIDMVVEKSNDLAIAKSTSAMRWAECMEEKDEFYMGTDTFKRLTVEKQDDIRESSRKKIDNFRTRALELVLDKQGVNVSAPSSNPSDKVYKEAVLNETKKVTQEKIEELKTQQTTVPAAVSANPNIQAPKTTQETIQVLEKQVQEVTKVQTTP
jgi:hypothetical protein